MAGNRLCASDLHAMDAPGSPPHLEVRLPMTLGHEIAGWVEAVGPGVEGVEQRIPGLVRIGGGVRTRKVQAMDFPWVKKRAIPLRMLRAIHSTEFLHTMRL